MKLLLKRQPSHNGTTLGKLYVNDEIECELGDVSPDRATFDLSDAGNLDGVVAGNGGLRFTVGEASADGEHVCSGQSRLVILRAAQVAESSAAGVSDVLLRRDHFKVLDSVVSLDAVQVVDLHRRGESEERKTDDAVNGCHRALSIAAQVDADVSVRAALSENLVVDGGRPAASAADNSRKRAHAAFARYVIEAFVSGNGAPFFHRFILPKIV
jgi:hypothetical protein